MSLLPSGAIETGGYNINNSLRFRSSASAYLKRVPASAGSRTTWTWSSWIKRGALADCDLFGTYTGNTDTDFLDINIYNNTLRIGAWFTGFLATTQVLRDPSAWYHIVVAVDTTQATASNRIKMYINGVQVTSFGTANYPAQNATLAVNQAGNTYIGYAGGGGWGYFDGYMAEQYFIDGQALTPSSFGETDTTTGVWKPKKYTGTYGTNGFYLPFGTLPSSTYAGSFSGSNYLTMSAPANLAMGTGDFTIEFWYYQNSYVGSSALYDTRPTSTQGAYNTLYMAGGGYLYYSVNSIDAITSSSALNNNTWYHIAVTRSGTSTKLFINGTQSGSTYTDTTNYASVGTNRPIIGGNGYVAGYTINGNISNLRVVKGTALYTSNFVPPSAALTAVSGTQLLTLQNSTIIDNSANAYSITNNGSVTTTSGLYPYGSLSLGKDSSGNNNNWATNNINGTTSGTTYDAMTDVPTLTSATVANYCVLNPVAYYGGYNVLSQGNLQFTSGNTNWMRAVATFAVSSGKWYWEITANNSLSQMHGILTATTTTYYSGATNWVGYDSTGYGYFSDNGQKWNNNAGATYGSTFGAGDIIGVAFDADNGTLTFYKNNVSQGTAFTGLTSGPYVPAVSVATTSGANTCSVNFGQRPFAYTPPTGFVALNTYNLPDSTIKKGNSYMDAVLWTGDGTSPRTISSYNFAPDFIWSKNRNGPSVGWNVYDTTRGAGNNKELVTHSDVPEGGDNEDTYGYLSAFTSNGFTATAGTGSPQYYFLGSYNYVAYGLKANGGTTSSNTQGSITSTVQANTTAGFSIVTYTGTGANATVGHGLGVAPKMIILKGRSSTFDWMVYHTSLGNTNYLRFNQTNASAASVSAFNNTSPTSTVFSLGDGSLGNAASATQVAYCFADIAGYSKFGSYTGNGSSDGPFVYLGFRPRFILYKNSSSGTAFWRIWDTARATYNADNNALYPNSSIAEDLGSGPIDELSNGFKIRTSSANDNGNGNTFIYAAFAENPFKNSLAR